MSPESLPSQNRVNQWPSVVCIKTNIVSSVDESSVWPSLFGLRINEGLSERICVPYSCNIVETIFFSFVFSLLYGSKFLFLRIF